MGYTIQRVRENDLNLVSLRDEQTGTEVCVLPELGALLHGYRIRVGKKSMDLIDHYSSIGEARRDIGRTFKSARLSPFTCRIAEGKWTRGDHQYAFHKKFADGSAIHGLMYDQPFRVVKEIAGGELASVTLYGEYNKEDPGYPFVYGCEITYQLRSDNMLTIRTTIQNNGAESIPVADGWHPYFTLGGSIDDCLLRFSASSVVAFDERLIPTGEYLPYDLYAEPTRLGHSFMDNCFLLNTVPGLPACEFFNPVNKVKISFFPDSSYPYLQIFTPAHRQSIAIENMSAAPDCFNNDMGLLLLSPGNSQTFTAQYQAAVL